MNTFASAATVFYMVLKSGKNNNVQNFEQPGIKQANPDEENILEKTSFTIF